MAGIEFERAKKNRQCHDCSARIVPNEKVMILRDDLGFGGKRSVCKKCALKRASEIQENFKDE